MFDNYKELLMALDVHAERVVEAHSEELHCRVGCTACCRQDLSVSRIEATYLLGWLVRHGVPEHDGTRTGVDAHPLFEELSGDRPCVFLGAGGGCGIYAARPIICRSHGLPLRLRDGSVDTCPLNFPRRQSRGYRDLPASSLLELDNLNQKLALIEVIFCKQEGEEPVRFPLSLVRQMALEILDEDLEA